MAEARMIVAEDNEVFHATSSHEAHEVTIVQKNQVQQVCTPCNIWKVLSCDLVLYADFTLFKLITLTVWK